MAHSRAQGTKTQGDRHQASKTNKEHSGQWPSKTQDKTQAADSNQNIDDQTKNSKGIRTDERNFDLVIDGVPYMIRTIPFLYNEELRFRVIVNGDAEHIFTWDSEVKMLRAIDDDASILPDRLEEAISEKLQNHVK